MTRPVNLPVFGLLMHAIELVHDRQGWGARPTVWVIAETDLGFGATLRRMWCGLPQIKANVEAGGFAAQQILTLDTVPGVAPQELFGNFVDNLTLALGHHPGRHHGDLAALAKALAAPEVSGFAVCAESRETGDDDRSGAWPGRVESRTVYAADRHTRVHLVHRRRGEDPQRDMSTPDRGHFAQSLLRLVEATNDAAPPPTLRPSP